MSTRKHRDSQQPEHGQSAKSESQGTAPSGQGKSPAKMMFLLWGVPLVFFIVIAVIKQCGTSRGRPWHGPPRPAQTAFRPSISTGATEDPRSR